MRVPVGARRRSWNWPASTVGKDLGAEARRRDADETSAAPRADTATTSSQRKRRIALQIPTRYDDRANAAFVLLASCPCASSTSDSTGTSVLESTYDEIIAKPTASDSGTNSCRPTPAMKNDGTNTASTHSMESSRGTAVFRHASSTARARDEAAGHVRVDVLDLHRRLVHQHADRQRQAAQRHDVDGLARSPEPDRPPRAARTGMVSDRRSATLRQSRRNSSTIRPVSSAPSSPSLIRLRMALTT